MADEGLQDRRVLALLDDGVPYRQVAALLEMSLGAVQRAEKRAREAPPDVELLDDDLDDLDDVDDEDDQGDDEVVGLGDDPSAASAAGVPLDDATLVWLGLTAEDAAGFTCNDLHLYRLQGIVGTDYVGRARARARSGREFAEWLFEQVGAAERVGGDEPMPANLRDARIVELRRSGWSLERIAADVGLRSRGAVTNALARIAGELDGSVESGRPDRKRGPSGRGTGTGRPPAEQW